VSGDEMEHPNPAPLAEFMVDVAPTEAQIARVVKAAERCGTTTTIFLALADWYEHDLCSPEGAKLLRELAEKFGDYERRRM